uniref:Uncharacterized protein n=1 Tax=Picea glauca TaxID=3330 RepID=A0A101LUQ4_PICGL|nr:hypothetical protein ABT39_MTgene2538 [Picea glauca]
MCYCYIPTCSINQLIFTPSLNLLMPQTNLQRAFYQMEGWASTESKSIGWTGLQTPLLGDAFMIARDALMLVPVTYHLFSFLALTNYNREVAPARPLILFS